MFIKLQTVFYMVVFLIGTDFGFAAGIARGQDVPSLSDSLELERLPAIESRVQELENELASLRSRLGNTNEVFTNACHAGGCNRCGGGSCDCCLGSVWPCGIYGSLSGGFQDRDIGRDINLATAAEWSTGFGFSGMVGVRTDYNVRAEFEVSLLDNENERFYFPPFPVGGVEPSSGHVTLRSFMFNMYYDIPLDSLAPNLRRLRPYVGGGLGTTESRINGVTSQTLQAGIPGVFDPTVLDTASRYTYTWQTRAGFSYLLTRRVEFFSGWRHLETRTLEFKTIQFPDVVVVGANVDEMEFGFRLFW